MENKHFILLVIVIFSVTYLLNQSILIVSRTKVEKREIETESFGSRLNENATFLSVPAVDRRGNGVIVNLSVEARPGNGRTLVDIDQILFWVDTQDSIRTAKFVAQNYTGLDLSKYDIIYSIQAKASLLEGPSAGAALAIATIFELEGKKINKNITITGTLDKNGKIGKVSGILEKAKAAKEANLKMLLVPRGQKYYTIYHEEEKCENLLFTTICRTETVTERVNVEEEVGISVVEVGDIEEALKYFAT